MIILYQSKPAVKRNERLCGNVISSHLIHDVELTCDSVGIVYGGKLINVESMDEILKSYSSLENYYLSEVGENE